MKIPEYLFHYFELDQGPFRNITNNEFEEAVTIQNNISKGFNSKRPPNYISLRFALEKRLKESFIAKNRKPNRNDPFYFTLGECNWVKSLYDNPGVVKIPLKDIDAGQISFTYPDSMVSFQFYDEPKLATYRKTCNGQVYLLEELSTLIDEFGLPSEDIWQSQEAMKYDRYIEAQLWDDTIIQHYQNQ